MFTSSITKQELGAILDSGACPSVVDKFKVDHAMTALNISSATGLKSKVLIHRFGSHDGKTLHAVLFLLSLKNRRDETIQL